MQLGLHGTLPAHQSDLLLIERIDRGCVETLEPGRVLRELAARRQNTADKEIHIIHAARRGVTQFGVKLARDHSVSRRCGERVNGGRVVSQRRRSDALSTSGTAFRAIDPEEQRAAPIIIVANHERRVGGHHVGDVEAGGPFAGVFQSLLPRIDAVSSRSTT